jgi:hypothetical protein
LRGFYGLTLNGREVQTTNWWWFWHTSALSVGWTFEEAGVEAGALFVCDVPAGDVSISVTDESAEANVIGDSGATSLDVMVCLSWDFRKLIEKVSRVLGRELDPAELEMMVVGTTWRERTNPVQGGSLEELGLYPGVKIHLERRRRWRNEAAAMKPAIYLYPEQATDVRVKLDFACDFSCVYPGFDDPQNQTWFVRSGPDGKIRLRDGRVVPYLFWEGATAGEGLAGEWESREGFLVERDEAEEFLEGALGKLGLVGDELFGFVVFWAPRLRANEVSFVRFQTDAYVERHPMEITPLPDVQLRVFMLVQRGERSWRVTPQELWAPERRGFTLVEWGGALFDE